MSNKKLIETTDSGIVCDNKPCDFEDRTVKFEDLKNWIDAPCPKCGHNLLTKEDFDSAELARKSIDFINALSEEDLSKLTDIFKGFPVHPDISNLGDINPDELLVMSIKAHNGINIESIKKVPNKKDQPEN